MSFDPKGNEIERLRVVLEQIANDRTEPPCKMSLDYMQGYRHGQVYMAAIAREALK